MVEHTFEFVVFEFEFVLLLVFLFRFCFCVVSGRRSGQESFVEAEIFRNGLNETLAVFDVISSDLIRETSIVIVEIFFELFVVDVLGWFVMEFVDFLKEFDVFEYPFYCVAVDDVLIVLGLLEQHEQRKVLASGICLVTDLLIAFVVPIGSLHLRKTTDFVVIVNFVVFLACQEEVVSCLILLVSLLIDFQASFEQFEMKVLLTDLIERLLEACEYLRGFLLI